MLAIGCPSPEQIAAAISGDLAVTDRGDVLDHAALCATCHAVLVVLESAPRNAVGSAPAARTAGILPGVGDEIGRYVLDALLGSGGMGIVYRARDTQLGRDVALKVLRPGRPADRLRREAQLLARLDAPNIITVYDVGEHAGTAYVVMELVDGKSLRAHLRQPCTTDDILAICMRAGEGLAAAHRAGVVHRDFKPDNVFVAPDGSVHVGDFGLAGASPGGACAVTDPDLTATGMVLGTPAYMAPEQIDGEATPRSDQYAFCVTVWEALTGKRPIEAPNVDELFVAIRAGAIAAPARPLRARVERALRRGMSRDPDARFADMPALLAALAPPRRRGLWVAGGIAALGIGGLLAAAAIRDDEPGCALGPRTRPASLAAVEAAFGPSVRAAAEAELAAWDTARAAACRLHDRPRFGCLELIAARGDATLAQLAMNAALEPDLAELGVERGLTRCLALPPSLTPALAIFDVEAARVDALLQLAPRTGERELPRLEQLAKAIGEPAIVRAQWLAARSAADRSDHATAVALLPRSIASADKLHDDELRARASALLAEVLGRSNRTAEARVALEQAGASWARVGRRDELAHARAEIAILVAENQPARAAQLAEDLVPLVRERYAGYPSRITAALGRASSLWSAAGNYARAAELQAAQIELAAKARPDLSPEEIASLHTNVTALLTAGDHRGHLTVLRRNLEIFQRALVTFPESERDNALSVGYAIAQIAGAHELLAESAEALVWFRNLHAFADDARLDPLVGARFRAEALEGEARHLNRLGHAAEAIAPARAVIAIAREAADVEIKSALPTATIQLARALHATGAYREARDLLEAIRPTLAATTAPFTRGSASAYLAYVLWETGDERDRGRARALAGDAARDFAAARAVLEAQPSLRPLIAELDKDIAALARWRAAHATP